MKKDIFSPEKFILLGIPVLFFTGMLFHFLYGLSGQNILVGLFAPVNESVWEHLKMALWPMLLGWWLLYLFAHKQYAIDKDKWFTGALTALFTVFAAMVLLYYFYTGAFGFRSVIVDIFIWFLALLLGQLLGLHVYRRTPGMDASVIFCIFIVTVIFFMVFTFLPPFLPLFQDGIT